VGADLQQQRFITEREISWTPGEDLGAFTVNHVVDPPTGAAIEGLPERLLPG